MAPSSKALALALISAVASPILVVIELLVVVLVAMGAQDPDEPLRMHVAAVIAVQAGANVKVLQRAMGHSDIRLTLDTYGGLFGDDLDALADRMDEAASHGASPANGSAMVPLLVAGD
jgi:hypothetical protein